MSSFYTGNIIYTAVDESAPNSPYSCFRSFKCLAAHCTVSMQHRPCATALLDQIEGELERYHHTLTTVSLCQTVVAATLHCIHVLQCLVVQSCLQQCNVRKCRAPSL